MLGAPTNGRRHGRGAPGMGGVIGMLCADDVQFIALYSFALSALWLKLLTLWFMEKARAARRLGRGEQEGNDPKRVQAQELDHSPFTGYQPYAHAERTVVPRNLLPHRFARFFPTCQERVSRF